MKVPVLLILMFFMMVTSCDKNEKMVPSEEGDFSNQLTEEEIKNARLTPEMLWKFGRLSDMQLSPDGSRVIYTVTRYDAKTDKSHTWIYIVPSTGGETRNLTEGAESCSNPRWITDNLIAFLCKSDDESKIWTMDPDGSGRKIISEIKGSINAFGFSPNGRSVYYTQDVKLDSSTTDRYPDLPLAKGMAFDDMMYRHWD